MKGVVDNMVELILFNHADFQQLIDWIETPEFFLQWGGPNFDFPLDEKYKGCKQI